MRDFLFTIESRKSVVATGVLLLATPWLALRVAYLTHTMGWSSPAVHLAMLAVPVSVATSVYVIGTKWRPASRIPHPASAPLGLPPALISLFVGLGALAAYIGLQELHSIGQTANQTPTSIPESVRVISWVGSVLIAPIGEEIRYRWFVYRFLRPASANSATALKRIQLILPALVISSLLFGFSHHSVSDLPTMLSTALVGLVFAAAYEITGYVAVPIFAHMFVNMAAELGVGNGAQFELPLVVVFSLIVGHCLVRVKDSTQTNDALSEPQTA